jgi:hypothetical protein
VQGGASGDARDPDSKKEAARSFLDLLNVGIGR